MEATLVSVTTMLLVVVVEVVVVEGGGGCVSSCPEMSLLHDEGPAESSPFSPPSPSPPTASSDHITTEDDFGELPERGRFFFECFGTKNNEKNSSLGENVCDKLMEGSVNVTRNTRRGACGGTYLVDNGAWVEMQLPSEQHTCDVLIKAANNTRLTIHCPTFRLGARHEEVLFLTHGDSLGGLYYLQRRPSLPAGVRQLYLMYARGQKEALEGSAAACVVVGREDLERGDRQERGRVTSAKGRQPPGCGTMCGLSESQRRGMRVVGGEEAVEGEFPWVALLLTKKSDAANHLCGGAILTDSTVLTAAHCVHKGSSTTVSVGKHNRTQTSADTQLLHVRYTIIHPLYDEAKLTDDIALLVLAEKIEWKRSVQPLCLYPSKVEKGELTVLAGWGLTVSKGQVSEALQKVYLDILSHDECKEMYASELDLPEDQMCAASPGKDSCRGDSGGPLMMLDKNIWYQVGLVSKGKGCAFENYTSIYTRISPYTDWILQHTEGSCHTHSQRRPDVV